MPPPPPPPPAPPGNGAGPQPPPLPPSSGPNLTAGFKIVPGLGDALHEMKRKISGVEETPACAEGTASEANRQTSTPSGTLRPKSWHGSQVPGKPKINRAMFSEMQSKLAKRRDKVDKEAYVVESPENALPPTGQKPRSVSCTNEGNRKSCTPASRGWTPPVDYGPRRMSRDSGRDSWTPTSDRSDDPQRRVSVDYSHYRKVSVDLERKEELCLAKEVRKSSVKMLGRASPSLFDPNVELESVIQTNPAATPPPVKIPPPSPVVMRYWKQCSNAGDDSTIENEDNDDDTNGQSVEPSWKTDALEGEITEFPSIKNKIASMEDEAKPKMFVVPDVKSKMRQAAPAAGWMEARSKLQHQLDTLITKTSAKMSKYGNVNAVEPKEFTKESSSESEQFYDAKADREESPKAHKLVINNNIKSLIKSVANEIQKSFSSKNIPVMGEGDDGDETKDENNNEDQTLDSQDLEKSDYWRNLTNTIRTHPQNIDMEPPIDFDYNEPKIEKEDVKQVTEDVIEVNTDVAREEPLIITPTNTILEEPVNFDSAPAVLDASVARSKANLMRKTSTERRLPASVLAKKKAAEKLKEILHIKTDASTGSDKPNVIDKIKKELIDASLQVDISNTEYDLENLNDEEKADLLAKQISKMDTNYVMKLLKQIEKGILDISIPMLIPFLSLQVRMNLGTNIFKGLEPQNKKKIVKENFINDMIEDITDIALLQEVIDRTQEKLNMLRPTNIIKSDNNSNYFSLEDDSFDLPSAPIRYVSPQREETPISTRASDHDLTYDNLLLHLKQISSLDGPNEIKTKKEATPTKSDDTEDKDVRTAKTKIPDESDSKIEEKTEMSETEGKKSDDEGLPSSEFDSSSDEDKEENKDTEEKKSIISEKTEDDEGIGKEQETSSKVENEPKEGKENVIKKKLLNIIENAKTVDQKRPTRNFGRTFEFQNVQLKPVLPNDRRPAKARRMDNMWNQTLAKQGIQINLEPPAPKPKVPWTMKKNPQPQKKDEDKDVDEFEKCRDALKNSTGKPTPSLGKDIKTIQKLTATGTNKNKIESISEGTKEELKIECINETSKEIIKETIECKNTSVTCISNETSSKKVLSEKCDAIKTDDNSNNLKITDDSDTVLTKEKSIPTDNVKSSTDVSVHVTESKSGNQISSQKTVDDDTADTINTKISADSSANSSKSASQNTSRDQSPSEKSDDESSMEDEWEPSNEENITKEKIDSISIKTEQPKSNVIPEEEKNETISTPIIRRRGDTVTVVLPPPKSKPPPPPMFRPPPPPMSPPVPVCKVKDLEKENKLIIEAKNNDNKPIESEDSEEEEESEWEWTEEEEEEEETAEEESECEVKKEGWKNIMSSSKGPTTFKAEYCLKVGGK